MRKLSRVFAVWLGVGIWSTASADCDSGFDGDQFFTNYEILFNALRAKDDQVFMEASAELATSLPCLSETVPPRMLAAAYRMLGVRQYRMSDADGAVRWMRTAREIDPSFEWDISTLGLDAPERSLYAQQELYANIQPVAVPGKMLAKPSGTRIALDGRDLSKPEATGDRFHLVQVVDLRGPVLSGTIILGNAFPADLLAVQTQEDAGQQAENTSSGTTASSSGSKGRSGTVRIERQRPPLKTPILGVGGVGLAGAIGLYAMSTLARGDYDEATTQSDQVAARERTNGLFKGACGLLTVGVATTSWGLYMADGPGFGLVLDW